MGQHDKRRSSISSSSPSDEGIDVDDNYLEPFVHQVGGHGSVLCWNETTVCKPYSSRERQFYECLPVALKSFTAEFKGMIQVEMHEDDFGYLSLIAYPAQSHTKSQVANSMMVDKTLQSLGPPPVKRRNTKILLHRSGSLKIEHSGHSEVIFVDDNGRDDASSFFNQNPWSVQCQTRHLAKLRRKHGDKHHFILLENLLSNFKLPCVLDLKMGTQQHGVDATEAKRKSQSLKCQQTTSSAIGVRLCGMQVYHRKMGVFKCHNKYFGRSLSVEGFKGAIKQFLHDGAEYRRELLTPCLLQLESLRELIEKCDSCRFFSSSLLIIYDGHVNSDEPVIKVRMIDFEHSTVPGFRNDPTYDGVDRGYVNGLNCVIEIIRNLSNAVSGAQRSSCSD